MRYIHLTKSQEETLREGLKNHPKAHFRTRCQALLLSTEGINVKVIARITGTRTRTIYSWMNRWEKHGLAGLMIFQGRGRKVKL